MKRPNKKDYLTTNQFTYNEKLNEYYEQLEKYVDYCEQQLNLAFVIGRFSESIKTEKCPNCGGTGIIKDGKYSDDCMKCYGSGQVEIDGS